MRKPPGRSLFLGAGNLAIKNNKTETLTGQHKLLRNMSNQKNKIMKKRSELIQSPAYWLDKYQGDIFRALVSYMEEKGLNQTQLSEELGVSKGYVSQILNGNFNFTLKKMIELSLSIGRIPDLKLEPMDSFIGKERKQRVTPNLHNVVKLNEHFPPES